MSDIVHAEDCLYFINALKYKFKDSIRSGLDRCARLAQREAIANAPRSPTQAQKNALRKTKRKVTRKATAHSRTMPGGLEKSIGIKVHLDNASVFVASNSQAGRYGARIHDGKGKSWRNRGAGTIAKGARADDKFIERAIKDNQKQFETIFKDEAEKALRKV